jgi:Cu+-exporting ATPase
MAEGTDPVCGMQIDSEDAMAEARYDGKSYYFCSEACRNKWEADPERYARKGVPTVNRM